MSGSVRQKAKVGFNSKTRITNTYPIKRGSLTKLPLNSNIHFEKDFDKASLSERIARLKSSPAYKKGESRARAQMQSLRNRKGRIIKATSGRIKVNIS